MDVNGNWRRVWKFDKDDLEQLKGGEGGVMELAGTFQESDRDTDTDTDRNSYVGAMRVEQKEQYFEEWRYMTSKVSSLPVPTTSSSSEGDTDPDPYPVHEHVVEVLYIDNNYLGVINKDVVDIEKALVLDVSFWNPTPYNSVNFVGGWIYKKE